MITNEDFGVSEEDFKIATDKARAAMVDYYNDGTYTEDHILSGAADVFYSTLKSIQNARIKAVVSEYLTPIRDEVAEPFRG